MPPLAVFSRHLKICKVYSINQNSGFPDVDVPAPLINWHICTRAFQVAVHALAVRPAGDHLEQPLAITSSLMTRVNPQRQRTALSLSPCGSRPTARPASTRSCAGAPRRPGPCGLQSGSAPLLGIASLLIQKIAYKFAKNLAKH